MNERNGGGHSAELSNVYPLFFSAPILNLIMCNRYIYIRQKENMLWKMRKKIIYQKGLRCDLLVDSYIFSSTFSIFSKHQHNITFSIYILLLLLKSEENAAGIQVYGVALKKTSHSPLFLLHFFRSLILFISQRIFFFAKPIYPNTSTGANLSLSLSRSLLLSKTWMQYPYWW